MLVIFDAMMQALHSAVENPMYNALLAYKCLNHPSPCSFMPFSRSMP